MCFFDSCSLIMTWLLFGCCAFTLLYCLVYVFVSFLFVQSGAVVFVDSEESFWSGWNALRGALEARGP